MRSWSGCVVTSLFLMGCASSKAERNGHLAAPSVGWSLQERERLASAGLQPPPAAGIAWAQLFVDPPRDFQASPEWAPLVAKVKAIDQVWAKRIGGIAPQLAGDGARVSNLPEAIRELGGSVVNECPVENPLQAVAQVRTPDGRADYEHRYAEFEAQALKVLAVHPEALHAIDRGGDLLTRLLSCVMAHAAVTGTLDSKSVAAAPEPVQATPVPAPVVSEAPPAQATTSAKPTGDDGDLLVALGPTPATASAASSASSVPASASSGRTAVAVAGAAPASTGPIVGSADGQHASTVPASVAAAKSAPAVGTAGGSLASATSASVAAAKSAPAVAAAGGALPSTIPASATSLGKTVPAVANGAVSSGDTSTMSAATSAAPANHGRTAAELLTAAQALPAYVRASELAPQSVTGCSHQSLWVVQRAKNGKFGPTRKGSLVDDLGPHPIACEHLAKPGKRFTAELAQARVYWKPKLGKKDVITVASGARWETHRDAKGRLLDRTLLVTLWRHQASLTAHCGTSSALDVCEQGGDQTLTLLNASAQRLAEATHAQGPQCELLAFAAFHLASTADGERSRAEHDQRWPEDARFLPRGSGALDGQQLASAIAQARSQAHARFTECGGRDLGATDPIFWWARVSSPPVEARSENP